jgi:phospholipid/cholesterol/gamma-HCH transport system substrate-binding protein
MDERLLRIRVGMFVVLAMVVLGILIFVNSEGFKPKYSLKIKPSTAPGVTQNTPVRKNGILIGRVGKVRTKDDNVEIELRIDRDEQVYANEVVSIGTDSILGDAVVEIIPVGIEKRGDLLADGGAMTLVSVKRNPLDIVDVAINLETKIADALETVRKAGASVEEAGVGVRQVMDKVSSALGDDESDFKTLMKNFQETNKRAQTALDNFNKIFESVNEVVGDPKMKDNLRNTIDRLPQVFDEIKTTVVETRDTINSFREVSGKFSSNLDNIEEFTETLREVGPDVLIQIQSSLKNAGELTDQIKSFSQTMAKVQSGEGTLGKLLKDPELYNNANQAVANVRDLTVKLEPLVNDLRMFSDSIARDPGQLGLRGMRDKRATGTGYKGTTEGQDKIESKFPNVFKK